MDIQALQLGWVPPFGYPRIVVCVRLPEAFRRLLRPSSALYAKTSAVRPFSFNLLRELFLDFRFKIFFLSQHFRKTYLSFFCYSVFKELPALKHLLRDPSKLNRLY